MLEGLEVSEVLMSYVCENNSVFRFDSNYFKKIFLQEETVIRKHKTKSLIELEASLLSFGAYSLNNFVEYIDKGIPFIRGINMKSGRISFSDMTYINKEANELLWKSEVFPETILLSMSGTIGDVAIASRNWEYPINSNQDIAKIRLNHRLNPYYLYAFLLTEYGQNYLKREARGSVQQHVFLSQIELFEIPLFSGDFYGKIENTVLTSEILDFESQKSYSKAEQLLLKELGLDDFEPSQEPVNVKSFSQSFGSSGRLDAEYYQVKYDDLESILKKKNKVKVMEKIRTENFRGLQPKYSETGSLKVINSKHILEDTLDYDGFERTGMCNWDDQERARVYKNDILTYTTGANIGRTQVYLIDDKALASNHVNILRLKDGYNAVYVGFVMNSMVGRMQTEKLSAGSAQAELYPKDIDQFIIPSIDESKQQEIEVMINESFSLKKKSEKMLDVAKRGVEMAIEKDEQTALNWIEEQVADIEKK